jgi:predicted Zn-dependent protease
MFELLRRNERGAQLDPYLQTHPLTQERVATMRNHVRDNAAKNYKVKADLQQRHARMLAKLIAFTEAYEVVLRKYPASDNSVAGRYARAIAEFRNNNLEVALKSMRELIAQAPKDPFFYDTIGQMLFENARLNEAAEAYTNANRLQPNSALIATDLAKTLIAQEQPQNLPRAVALLQKSGDLDESNGFTWRQLAIAYGKQGNLGPSYLALAREAAVTGNHEDVLPQLQRAREYLVKNSPQWLEADDLERDADEQIRRKKEAKSVF